MVARRDVLVIDDGQPRNQPSPASHGFFSRDGASPAELRAAGRAQLEPYGVELAEDTVLRAEREAPASSSPPGRERDTGRAG